MLALLKIAFRNLIGFRVCSVLNILGLSIGLACAFLICIWVQHERSFDKFHEKANSLYIVYEDQYYANGDVFPVYSTPSPLAVSLKRDFSQVKRSSRWATSLNKLFVKANDNLYVEERLRMVDPDFFDMFSFPLVNGEKSNLILDENSIVLTQSTSRKYFGNEDPVGKEIVINSRVKYRVSAVVQDPAGNSSLQFDLLAPFELFSQLYDYDPNEWEINLFWTLLQLQDEIGPSEIQESLRGYLNIYVEDSNLDLRLQPLTRMHLFSVEKDGANGILYVNVFTCIAILILIIACLNFMNLSTARFARRSREVCIRKVFGASRKSLIMQFICESVCYALVAFGLAIVFVELVLPLFNVLIGRELEFVFNDYSLWLGMFLVALLAGVFSGSYPAYFMSAFIPISVFRGEIGLKSGALRRIFVVLQFGISVGVILCAVFVYLQLTYLQNKDIGFNKEKVFYAEVPEDFNLYYPLLKEELLKTPGVLWVTASSQMPVNISTYTGDVSWEDKKPDDNILFQLISVDVDFLETFEMDIQQGYGLFGYQKVDSLGFILNQEAVRRMGLDNPIGEKFALWGEQGHIIGVVNDFNTSGLKQVVEPLVILHDPSAYRFLTLRIKGENSSMIMKDIQRTWQNILPNIPFKYSSLERDFYKLYKDERRMASIFTYFAILAVIISCLGLFGLSSFVTEQRFKEMGLRKVMGASVTQVFGLLVRQFLGLVLIANAIAWPVVYIVISSWLSTYAYHISMRIGYFFLVGALTLGIAIMVVGYQAGLLATSSPVKSIEYQ